MERLSKKERLENDLEVKAERAFDCLVHSYSGIFKIDTKAAGAWVTGWKNLLISREFKGFWLKMPDILGSSLKARYVADGPALRRRVRAR